MNRWRKLLFGAIGGLAAASRRSPGEAGGGEAQHGSRRRSSRSRCCGPSRCPIAGSSARRSGVAVDSRDHIFVLSTHRLLQRRAPRSARAPTRRRASAARRRPAVLEYDAAGAAGRTLGRPRRRLRLADDAEWHRDRSEGQRVDRRQRRQRYANSQVLARRQVHRAGRQGGDRGSVGGPAGAAAPDTAYAGVSRGAAAAAGGGRAGGRRVDAAVVARRRSGAPAEQREHGDASAVRRTSRSTRQRMKRSSPTDRAITASP